MASCFFHCLTCDFISTTNKTQLRHRRWSPWQQWTPTRIWTNPQTHHDQKKLFDKKGFNNGIIGRRQPVIKPIHHRPSSSDWSYDSNQPWRKRYPTCGIGREQSPIELPPRTDELTYVGPFAPKLDSSWNRRQQFQLENNGHTVKVTLVDKRNSPEMSVLLGNRVHNFRFAQWHFHWGRISPKRIRTYHLWSTLSA